VWDQAAIPDKLLTPGGPTGAVIPLAWAHAEYIKLVRSIADQRVFDLIEPVRARYASPSRPRRPLEIWSAKRPLQSMPSGSRLRIVAGAPFTLRWTSNDWLEQSETVSTATKLGVWFVDLPASSTRVRFKVLPVDGGAVEEASVDIV